MMTECVSVPTRLSPTITYTIATDPGKTERLVPHAVVDVRGAPPVTSTPMRRAAGTAASGLVEHDGVAGGTDHLPSGSAARRQAPPRAARRLRTGAGGRDFVGHASRDEAILDATIELLGRQGYHGLTMEGVARLAGVGKATVYRRWASKGALVGEAVATRLSVAPVPDRGNLREDLVAAIDTTIHNYAGTVAGVVIPAVVSDLGRDPQLLTAFREQFLHPRRRESAAVLERAIERGDLPAGIDIELVMDAWAGAIFYRALISGRPIRPEFAEHVADLLLQGMLPRELTEDLERPLPAR